MNKIIEVACPREEIELKKGDIVRVRCIHSQVSNGCYIACEYKNRVIGMCDDDPILLQMKEEDYVEASVLKIEFDRGSTKLRILLK